MSSGNAVLWKEGLFVKPQHFQQMTFAAESALQQRVSSLNDTFYGFSELELNAEYLSFGKVAIMRARGVMPDGTVFDIPGDMPPPAPLEIPQGTANKQVYLTLPLHASGAPAVRWPADVTDFALLQVLNRLHPYFHHLARRRNVHPEQLHIALSQACGEVNLEMQLWAIRPD